MFHGVILDISLKGIKTENLFKILNTNKNSSWGINIVEVKENELENKIKLLQQYMNVGTWYEHFYDNDNKLIVVFKKRYFI
ncbi:MAG: hypothetical protein WDA21_02585 [Bacilli bacterium]